MSGGVLAVLAAVAVLLVPVSGGSRPRPARERRPVARRWSAGRHARTVAAVAVAAAVALVLGGPTGVLVGTVAGAAVLAAIARLEPGYARREREELERSAPLVLDLVAACLASGATLDASMLAAASAVGGPAERLLGAAVTAGRLGAPAPDAWREVAARAPLAGLARAVVRAHDSGAPLAEVLPRLAAQARATRRSAAETRVRTAGVRLTGPLGVAFLPAFVLLGVVPVVASWVGALV